MNTTRRNITKVRKLNLTLLAAVAISPIAEASDWYVEAAFARSHEGAATVGYEIHPNISLETGLIQAQHPRNFSQAGAPRYNIQAGGVKGHHASLRSSWDISPRWTFTGRVGLYHWDAEAVSFSMSSPVVFVDEKSGTSALIGTGVRARLSQRLSASLEYLRSDGFSASNTSDKGMLALGARLEF